MKNMGRPLQVDIVGCGGFGLHAYARPGCLVNRFWLDSSSQRIEV